MCSKSKITDSTSNLILKDYPQTVYNSLLGISVSNKNVVVLDNYQIIMRRDHHLMSNKVKIIGGGCAGNELAEAYYVGKGMLTAAVFGEKYSAPSADEVLVAIRELAKENPNGVLLLAKNYLGDKLNLGLALDKAIQENIKVKMLVIGDDIDETYNSQQGRKGLAGCVLVYKIVGEMAEQEKTLEEIISECRNNILTSLVTVSVTLPPKDNIFYDSLRPLIQPDEVVFGMGVYGQQGNKKVKFTNLKGIINEILEDIFSFLRNKSINPDNYDKDQDFNQNNFVILINNLGLTSKLEENIVVKEIFDQLIMLDIKVALFYSGRFMACFNSYGFSISILKINSFDVLDYLDAPTSALNWPKTNAKDLLEVNQPLVILSNTVPPLLDHSKINKFRYENISLDPNLSDKAAAVLKQITLFAAEALISCKKQLNIINSETGNGDAGTVLGKGAEALRTALINDSLNVYNAAKFLFDISDICCKHMGGLTGALYSVFFSSAGKVFLNVKEITPKLCASAFLSAVKAIKMYGKAELGDRTVLDALHPAAESFESAILNGKNLTEAAYLAAATCEFKAEETKLLKPFWFQNLGVEKQLIYPDAGAHAATIWLRAISEGLKLTYPTFEKNVPTPKPGIFLWKFLSEEDTLDLLKHESNETYFVSLMEKKLGVDEALFIILLNEIYKYAREHFKNDTRRISALVGTVYYTHTYFTSSQWKTSSDVYFYFRESILCQTVESPPKSTEIFSPEEAKDALIFFFETYIRNLPLVRILHLPHYILRLKIPQDKNSRSFFKSK